MKENAAFSGQHADPNIHRNVRFAPSSTNPLRGRGVKFCNGAGFIGLERIELAT